MRRPFSAAETAGLGLLLALVAVYAASPIFSIDFFWHLKLGEVMRETGAIPRTDLFSAVHPERPYVQFNWLWELLAALTQNAFGLKGVRAAQALVLTASFALLYAHARRALGAPALALAFCALALVLFEDRFRARPSALALGFFAAMLPVLLGGYRSAGKSAIAYMALLAAFWSNLHGGESVLLLLSLGALVAGELLHRSVLGRADAPVLPALRLLLVAGLFLLVSPTFLDGLRHWLSAVGPQIETGNEEWIPSYTMLRNGFRPTFVIIGLGPSVVALAYVIEQARRVRAGGRASIDAGEWLLCAGYLALAHHAVRNAFLCLLPVLFMLRRASPRVSRHTLAAGAIALSLLAVSFEDAVLRGYGGLPQMRALFGEDLAPGAYPKLTAQFMRQAGIEGRVNNDGRWGGYLIWQTWPKCHVLADSRHDLTPELWPLFLASHDPFRRTGALVEGHARYGLELAAFRAPMFPLHVPPSGWMMLFKAGEEELAMHTSGPNAEQNLARARAWLAQHGVSISEDASRVELSDALTRVGATQWMSEPLQRLRFQAAERERASGDPGARARGHAQLGSLRWQAGLYHEATVDLEQAIALDAERAGPRYHLALSGFALGELSLAQAQLGPLARLQRQLSATQRKRLALLEQALRSHALRPSQPLPR